MLEIGDWFRISIPGVIFSTVIGQIVTILWFGPLFSHHWVKFCRWNYDEAMEIIDKNQRGKKSLYFSFLEHLVSMLVLGVLIHNMNITTISGAMTFAGFLWFGFMATVSVNEVLWHGEKLEFYILNQASYFVRSLVMAASYAYLVL